MLTGLGVAIRHESAVGNSDVESGRKKGNQGKNMATKNAKAAEVEVKGADVKDDFLPEGWVEVSSSGAPIYKPEAAVAEGADLEGVAYDVIFCRGGASKSEVWEAIVFRVSKPTIGFNSDGQQVKVNPGEDIIIANSALLGEIARRAQNPRVAQYVKVRPTELKDHASRKGWSFWDFRVAFGPTVDRAKENLHRLPERTDILEHLAAFEAKLKESGEKAEEQDKKILASYHARTRTIQALEASAALPALPA